MKKVFLISFFLLCMFGITGCGNENEKLNGEFSSKDITGKVLAVNLNENKDIIINKSDISRTITYYCYEYEGVTIGLIAIKDSDGDIHVVVNTCQSCGGSPNAYFTQTGDKIQCQNCKSFFFIDNLDNLATGGCNPIAIEDLTENDEEIIIGAKQLNNLKDKFENWNGPKVS